MNHSLTLLMHPTDGTAVVYDPGNVSLHSESYGFVTRRGVDMLGNPPNPRVASDLGISDIWWINPNDLLSEYRPRNRSFGNAKSQSAKIVTQDLWDIARAHYLLTNS
jgi:hypothetical protein